VPPTTYRSVEPKLFERIIDQTVAGPGKGGVSGAWRPPLRQAGG
jgi:COX Aromatic Rich Motif